MAQSLNDFEVRDFIKKKLIEKFDGDNTTYTVSIESEFEGEDGAPDFTVSGELEIPITNEDDDLGSSIVEYCDNTDGEGYRYGTGKVYFDVNQK